MTELVDRIIDSLSAHHAQLVTIVEGLTDDQLEGPSGASEWRICDVFSHLGSGAEITVKPVIAAATGVDAGPADNQAIWDRWNAATPREQATWFVEHDAVMVAALTGLSAEQRGALMIDMGFLPEPVPLSVAAGVRLNEVAAHTWDITVGLDPEATLDAEAADLLLTLYGGPISFMLGFTGKPDQLQGPASVLLPTGAALVIDDSVSLVADATDTTATFVGPAEAVVRLISGRLGEARTSEDVDVTGNVSLADLRRVFPGF